MRSDDALAENAVPTADETVVSLVEEVARVDISTAITGRTRVTTRTETVSDDIHAELESRGVEVVRVPVGRDLDPDQPIPSPREEGDTTINPVFEEILVVEKRLRLVEEVHIRRTTETEDVRIPVTRRRQVAEIEHDDLRSNETSTETK